MPTAFHAVYSCMEITQAMQESLLLSLLRHDKTPSGVECSFFQFGTIGVKFYGYGDEAKEKARKAFSQQSTCYENDLAPKPGKLFAISIKGAGSNAPISLHGYTTEIAIVMKGWTPNLDDEICTLRQRLHAAGLPSGDLHSVNVGYVVDTQANDFKLVPIDFGWHFAGE